MVSKLQIVQEELDVITREKNRLEMERISIEKEDKNEDNERRLDEIKSRIASLDEQMIGLSDKWKEEKKALDHIKELKDQKVRFEALKDKGRALVFKDSIEDIQYFLVKSNDCITYVNHGVADIGVDLH